MRRILVVEDNRSDVFLIRESIDAAQVDASIEVAQDGEKAIAVVDQIDADESIPPDLVILDINLPKREGRDVLSHMRRSRRCRGLIVLVVTSSNSDRDRDEMERLGVSGYFRKPSDYASFMKLGGLVKELLNLST